jgi:hypothetical protein
MQKVVGSEALNPRVQRQSQRFRDLYRGRAAVDRESTVLRPPTRSTAPVARSTVPAQRSAWPERGRPALWPAFHR